MPGTRRDRGPINAQRERRSLRPKFTGPACGLLFAACVAAPAPLLTPAPVMSPRDSAALAYDTGRRDALLLHRPRTAVFVSAFAFPVGLVASNSTGELWVAPVATISVSLAGTLWAYRQTRLPIPFAPDSMRARYGLDEAHIWSRYQHGFQDAIDQWRHAEFQRSARSTVVFTLIGLTYLAILPRD